MLGFFEDLWQSVFTPGATPTLVLATHTTFAVLVTLLTIFAFLHPSIHIVNLLVLSTLLWGTLTWFIAELKKADRAVPTAEESEKEESKKTVSEKPTITATQATPIKRKSRKA